MAKATGSFSSKRDEKHDRKHDREREKDSRDRGDN